MVGQAGHRPGRQVGGGAHLERDAVVRQMAHQLGVLGRRDAVPDPLRAEKAHRVPDRLGSGGLPCVRHRVQAGGPRGVEVRRELLAPDPDLRTSESERDQPRRL